MDPIRLDWPLGTHPNSDEFQIERTIVWVMYPQHGQRTHWLEKANRTIEPIWYDVPRVLSFAAELTPRSVPGCWASLKLAATAYQPPEVWGIWIHPAEERAVYHVGAHILHELLDGLPHLPDDYSIFVVRTRDGILTEQTK